MDLKSKLLKIDIAPSFFGVIFMSKHKKSKKEFKEHKEGNKKEEKEHKSVQEVHKHSSHREEVPTKFFDSKSFWMCLAIVFAVALIISIPTQGFRVWKLSGSASSSSSVSGPRVIYLIENPDCTYCHNEDLNKGVEQFFQNFTVKVVPYNSAEGKKLLSKMKNITALPAFVVLKSQMESSPIWSRVNQGLFSPQGDYYYVSGEKLSRMPYYLNADERVKFEEKLAEQEKLRSNFENETSGKPRIDFFVMAYCPFGNQAEEAIAPVYYEALHNNATFVPHYIIYSHYLHSNPNFCIENGTLCSMHGIQEVHEDERELCVYNLYGIKAWFDFALAMNKNSTSQNSDAKWKAVAQSLGLDVNKIEDCVKENGVKYLQQEQALSEAVGAEGSPTVFVGGKPYNGARTPSSYMSAICDEYSGSKPAGCSMNLTSSTDASQNAHCG